MIELVLDTETTGKFEKHWHWSKDYMQYPYVLSIAWINGKRNYYMINQEGRAVPKEATAVNGITTAMANSKTTLPAKKVYLLFLEEAERAATLVGHNIYFDISIIKANILRTFGPKSMEGKRMLTVLHQDKRVDTMRATQKYFGKWPKLIELYQYLFNETFNNHDALEDAIALERCYKELLRRKMI